ncbi:MAG: 1-deoxy-D-xylulose-5-phosphate synthase [Clostridia bacterium]|nr:1-deoxy-D-xylulose-5-phosphate synthase [Clostridia bacterium]
MNLSEITSPAAIKNMPEKELQALADDIRGEIIRTVALNGGHLASNLGAVELTIALHRVLDCPKDKLVFDVGHQCYAHKILTGRSKQFSTLRKTDGICGFPRRDESPYDAFDTGHASTAISAALGMARAREMRKENWRVAAVVGDGAMTGGMCYEALNDAGSSQIPMMVVLNDNGMSISRNVGALSRQLTRLRVSRGWLGAKKNVTEALRRIPLVGIPLQKVFQRVKDHVRNVLVKDRFFTTLGFQYFGPIDGHDIAGMERVFRRCVEMDKPVLVHVVTKKGRGFTQAEEKPEKYHGVAPFELENGKNRGMEGLSMGKRAGAFVTELAQKDSRICAVTAAMTDSTGFREFAKRFPDRLYDVGIAEEHAVTMAAGMAAAGMRPFVAIYETFLQRAYDQMMEDVCLQRLPVCFLMDRAGLGAEDGSTHHGIYGVSMLRTLPHMTVLCPRCEAEMQGMIRWALTQDGPVAIRYPRSIPEMAAPACKGYTPGKWEILRQGSDACLLGASSILRECLTAAEQLEKDGAATAVINASTLRPLDEEMLRQLCKKGTPLFTVEEHALTSGFGDAVAAWCVKNHFPGPAAMIALPDGFIPHGSRCVLLERYGLNADSIAARVKEAKQG